MKIHASLQFRGYPDEFAARIPAKWKKLIEKIHDYSGPPEGHVCWTQITVSLEEANEIVDWGRVKEDGWSRLRSIRMYDRYELADLDDLRIVEVFESPLEQGEPYKILNAREALNAVQACAYCDRVDETQIADLDVRATVNRDFKRTENEQWLVSPRVQAILADAGIAFRPLKSGAYAQALIPQGCRVRTDQPPMSAFEPCLGCGLCSIFRDDTIEGNPWDLESPEIQVYRDKLVTIEPCNLQGSIARSDVGLHRAMTHPVPLHKAGQRLDYTKVLYRSRPKPLYFADVDLVRRLLKMEATGLSFRPVNIGQSAES